MRFSAKEVCKLHGKSMQRAQMEVIEFEAEDVITTSSIKICQYRLILYPRSQR